jgi:hypothetical protein
MAGVIGKPTWVILAGGTGAALALWNQPKPPAPKATPARTVVIHQTVTRVVHTAAPSLAPGIEHTIIAVVAIILAFGVLCAVSMRRR